MGDMNWWGVLGWATIILAITFVVGKFAQFFERMEDKLDEIIELLNDMKKDTH